jgi:very-short-patch-repair endonuclease
MAKKLRRDNTDVERELWRHLKSRQVEGIKFRRQQPIGRYIVDFVSFEKRIVIELDGGQHSAE